MISSLMAAAGRLRRWLCAPGTVVRPTRLCLLELESRNTPTVNALVWIGANGGLWSDANNWAVYDFNTAQLTTHHTPTSSDTLYFGDLGGANTSSEDDVDVTALEIIQSNTYTGSLSIDDDVTLTVSTSFTAYGTIAVAADGVLDAASVYLIGGSIGVSAIATPTTPLSIGLLDMVDGASLSVTGGAAGTTLSIDNLTMGTGTTFTIDPTVNVVVDGEIGCSGTISLGYQDSLTVTGDYTQPDGELDLPSGCTLTIEGTSPAELSGHTIIEGGVTITAGTVEVNGSGEMEYTSLPQTVLMIDGNFDVSGGTFTFNDVGGNVLISGDFDVFIGTLNMNVALDGNGAPVSNTFSVSGSVQLGPDDGDGGPTLNLNELTSIPSPTTFVLIGSVGTASGDFWSTTPTPLAQGWIAGGPGNLYVVTL